MNLSSPNFGSITSEFPEERDTLARLNTLLSSGRHQEMTLDHLALEVSPHSVDAFVRILERLVRMGVIGRVYRLESPSSRGKIEDYHSFASIPQRTLDWHADSQIDVTPRDIRVLYTLS